MSVKKVVLKRYILLAGILTLVILKISTTFADPKQDDINGDDEINISDLETMKTEMIRDDSRTEPCQADINDDGEVNISDLEIMKTEMIRDDCHTEPCQADINDDGKVNGEDAEILITEFDLGEEEDLEEGIEPQISRFKDNEDETVTDPETGLMWTKDADLPGDTMLFHEALDYIEEINEGKHPNFGYTDWRLPTIEELKSLIDYTKRRGWKHEIPSEHPFQNVQSLALNSYLSNSDYPLFVSLYCRLVGHNVKTCYGNVWPVRSK